ncbi:MAG TPA: hypothetical protein VFY79_13510 [Dehalococcoidia bacterium]|nr:hypothetical protein [Dehalococcoidia bacterium]
MDRSQAYETLNLHPSADGAMVADAYWRLVRGAQANGDTPEAAAKIERLNEAYATLNPKSAPPRPQVQGGAAVLQQAQGSGVWVLDVFADWVVEQARLTRARWPGRNLEIGLIGGAALFLLLLAVGAGASLLLSFAAAVVALVAIWAPWRRTD